MMTYVLFYSFFSFAKPWGFWGTAWCLIYQTFGLLRDVVVFTTSQIFETSWSQMKHVCFTHFGTRWTDLAGNKTSEFLELHPQHAELMPDAFSFYSLLLWFLAILLLSWRLSLGVCRHLWQSPEILFFPDPSGAHVRHVCHLLRSSRKRMWIAMFTLTDDVLSQEILNAWERGVDVKVILDDEQCNVLGADAAKLQDAGVPLLLDSDEARMHHKFAVLDACVLAGSFNWTKQASMSNWENLCILRDPVAVSPFAREFQRLWHSFAERKRTPSTSTLPGRRRHVTPPGRRKGRGVASGWSGWSGASGLWDLIFTYHLHSWESYCYTSGTWMTLHITTGYGWYREIVPKWPSFGLVVRWYTHITLPKMAAAVVFQSKTNITRALSSSQLSFFFGSTRCSLLHSIFTESWSLKVSHQSWFNAFDLMF